MTFYAELKELIKTHFNPPPDKLTAITKIAECTIDAAVKFKDDNDTSELLIARASVTRVLQKLIDGDLDWFRERDKKFYICANEHTWVKTTDVRDMIRRLCGVDISTNKISHKLNKLDGSSGFSMVRKENGRSVRAYQFEWKK